MHFPYYYHNVENWNPEFVLRYDPKYISLTRIRGAHPRLRIFPDEEKPFIIHCPYCFRNIDEYITKFRSFSHQEFNKPPYTTYDWVFKSHDLHQKVNSPNGRDLSITNWRDLIPDDPRFYDLVDPRYEYPLNYTSYTQDNLATLCGNKVFNRDPFKPQELFGEWLIRKLFNSVV